MNLNELLGKWVEVKSELKTRFSNLKDDELEKTKGNILDLLSLIEKKTGLTRESAKEMVVEILVKLGSDDVKEKFQRKAVEILSLTTMILDGIKYNIQKDLDEKEKSRQAQSETDKVENPLDSETSDSTKPENNSKDPEVQKE